MIKSVAISFFIALIFSSCSKENKPADRILIDVPYGNESAQKMDIYLPANANANNTKVIVLIHGGAWTSGDKSMSTQYVDTLKRRLPDFAIFNINYRLSATPENLFPTQEKDVQSAVEYIYNHRSEYNISDKFVLIGESAGGHLAMLYAYKYNNPVKIKAVVSFFGPSDLTAMYNYPVNGNTLISAALAQAVGATPVSNSQLYISSSPVSFITGTTAMPTILLHGGMDMLVSPSQSIAVRDKLSLAGIPNQYILYPGKDHGIDWDNLTFFDAFNKVQAFLELYVQ